LGGAWALGLALACASATPGRFPPADADLVATNEALGDPFGGRFPLEEATADLPGEGSLHAILHTDLGQIDCRLDPDRAPLNVANFIGLARGRRPFRGENGAWTTEPYYVDMPWHRAEPGQFVQTGRRGRLADGGFFLQDETGLGDAFDRAGILAMGNTGQPDSGSVQFFVTTGATPHLSGQHTILGRCDQPAVARRLETAVDGAGPPPRLQRIEIVRRADG
jgi:peptidyl-prolyl cis-trans isomerase A (cyclophilin A)